MKYFSKKRMEPKWNRIKKDFPWVTHVGSSLSHGVGAFSREPIHRSDGYYLPENILLLGEKSKMIAAVGMDFDWEKHIWEAPHEERAVEVALGCTGQHLENLEPFGKLSEINNADTANLEELTCARITSWHDIAQFGGAVRGTYTPPPDPPLFEEPEPISRDDAGVLANALQEGQGNILLAIEELKEMMEEMNGPRDIVSSEPRKITVYEHEEEPQEKRSLEDMVFELLKMDWDLKPEEKSEALLREYLKAYALRNVKSTWQKFVDAMIATESNTESED